MILTSGCFDGIHAGHVAFLNKLGRVTKEQICVAVASDEYIRRAKGREPRYTACDRLAAVLGLETVFHACLHGDNGIWDVLENGEPWTAFAKGFDWLPDRALADTCKRLHIPLIFIDSGSDLHSSR